MASDLIYREDARAFAITVSTSFGRIDAVPLDDLDELPAADVVEVVRCKDCINWNGNDCITMYGLSAPRPDDYCSRGEKNSG